MYWKIRSLLKARGIVDPPDQSFCLVDDSDGNGPRIESWNIAILGPPPTVEEILSVKKADEDKVTSEGLTQMYRKSGRRDAARLTLLALIAQRTEPTWAAMTSAERVGAVERTADGWGDLRLWIDKEFKK